MRRLSSPSFIGRAVELAELGGVATRVAAGQPATVIVSGAAGVGKTRFLSEFATAMATTGWLVLRGGCVDLGHGVLPYAPLVEALRPLAKDAGGADGVAALLGRLIPGLATAPKAADKEPGPLFEACLAVLGSLAEQQPTVVILEDLHWADASTRDLLGFLARNLDEERLLLVGTVRSDDVGRTHPLRPFLAELDRIGVLRMELAPFSRDEVVTQLAAIRGERPDPGLVTQVYARSEGNPFFVEELAFVDTAHDATALPPTVRAALESRIDRLTPEARRLVQAAAVAGRRVDEPSLAAVTGLVEPALTQAIRDALDQQILVIDPTGPQTYAFRHALLREAVYGDLLHGERRGLHAAWAAVSSGGPDGTDADRTAERAHHWYEARRLPEALVDSIAAASLATQASGFPAALAHLERALEIWDEVDDAASIAGVDRVELALRAGVAAARSRDHRRAAALLRAALGWVDEASDPTRAGAIHALLIGPLVMIGDRAGADRAIEDGSRLILPQPASATRARLLQGRAQSLLYQDRYPEARAVAEEALAVAREIRAEAEAEDAAATLLFATIFAGDVDAALTSARDRLRAAERDDDPVRIGQGWHEVGFVLQADLRFEAAADAFLAGARAVREHRVARGWRDDLECAAAESMRRAGRWAEADALTAGVIERGGAAAVAAHELRSLLLPAMGRLDEAERHARLAWEARGGSLTASGDAVYYPALAEIAIGRGEHEAARRAVGGGIALFAAGEDLRWTGELVVRGLRAEADRAEMARAGRSVERCLEARASGAGLLRRLLTLARQPRVRASIFAREADAPVLLARAEWSRLVGAPRPDRWDRAAHAWQAIGQPYPAAYARYRQAEALLARGGPREAVTAALRTAWWTAGDLGATLLTAEIDGLARRARITLETADGRNDDDARDGEADPFAIYRLTPREREVLVYVADGRSDREIADALFISDKTVSVHVSNIKGKLGVGTRIEAATLALRIQAAGGAASERTIAPPRTRSAR